MSTISLPKLTPIQHKMLDLHRGNSRVVLRCGRRTGKTVFLEYIAARAAWDGLPVAWMGPSYKVNGDTWRRLYKTLMPAVSSCNKIEQRIELYSGGSLEFWTLSDPDAGRSRRYALVIMDEASLVSGLAEIWSASVEPTLLDMDGSVVMAGTPKGEDLDNYFYVACSNPDSHWAQLHATTHENPYMSRDRLKLLELETPPLFYQQEYMAEFVSWGGQQLFRKADLLRHGTGLQPKRTTSVYAVVDTAMKDGSIHDASAVVYFSWCSGALPDEATLTILDWDLVRVQADLLSDWLPTVADKAKEYATQLKAQRPYATRVFIEDKASGSTLLQHSRRRGLPVMAIHQRLTQMGKTDRAVAASPFVYRGLVKLSNEALAKTVRFNGDERNHLLTQVCGFTIGAKLPHQMDLLDCFTYGVIMGCDTTDYMRKSVTRA